MSKRSCHFCLDLSSCLFAFLGRSALHHAPPRFDGTNDTTIVIQQSNGEPQTPMPDNLQATIR